MKISKKKKWKRFVAAALALSMVYNPVVSFTNGLYSAYAIDQRAGDVDWLSYGKGEKLNLISRMTYLPNNGNGLNTGMWWFKPNCAYKLWMEGAPADDPFSRFNGSYGFCVANHMGNPAANSNAYLERVWTWGQIPPENMEEEGLKQIHMTLFGQTPPPPEVQKYNFMMTLLNCYYNQQGKSASEVRDPYEGTAEWIFYMTIGMSAANGRLTGDFNTDIFNITSGGQGFAFDFQPDTAGSSRIYDEYMAFIAEMGYGDDRSDYYRMHRAAQMLCAMDYSEDMKIPTVFCEIKEDPAGGFVAVVKPPDTGWESTLWQDLEPTKLYGDWTFAGTGNMEGGGKGENDEILKFKSPTGEFPAEGRIADMSFRPESEFYGVVPSFTTGDIIQVYFNDEEGNPSGQYQLLCDLQGNFQVAVTNTLSEPHKPEDKGDSDVEVKRYEHKEDWNTTYKVNLSKLDSETGKPIGGSYWDILEAFDDSQLDSTHLDVTTKTMGSYNSSLGSLNQTEWGDDEVSSNYSGDTGLNQSETNYYNWKNGAEGQFEHWEGWDPGNYETPCFNDMDVTDDDGWLYSTTTGLTPDYSRGKAHTDTKDYTYNKGYCGGHPAPEIEYVEVPEYEEDPETGENNQDEIDAAEEENQQLHDDAWDAWFKEVQICEGLVAKGGFFHAIDEGVGQAAMEADRDEAYEDFIHLEYQYSAEELEAKDGYILHGLHKDDIPVETRTVTSSEVKDFNASGGTLRHEGASSGGEDSGDEDEDEEYSLSYLSEANGFDTISVLPDKVATSSEAAKELTVDELLTVDADVSVDIFINSEENVTETEESSVVIEADDSSVKESNVDPSYADIATNSSAAKYVTTNKYTAKKSTPSEVRRYKRGEGNTKHATSSEADEFMDEELEEEENYSIKGKLSLTGFVDGAKQLVDHVVSFFADDDEDDDGSGETGNAAVTFLPSIVNTISEFDHSIIDWTFIVYDHRTEGEVHFNKRDLDLAAHEDDGFDAYADSNGDGTLEGAVYGLFAKNEIVHPDNETGTVFKKDNLVAVTTTDRNGDGSFMAITEAPGMVYNYETGQIEPSGDGWSDRAPGNKHTNTSAGISFSDDNERFIGHDRNNNPISLEEGSSAGLGWNKLSSNQGIEDTESGNTTGSYPISNNEDNNGNCWIGRPLLLGDYYIRELTRSEGFELSVAGKSAIVTNRDSFDGSNVAHANGKVTVGDLELKDDDASVYFDLKGENLTTAGYYLYFNNLPQNIRPIVSTSQIIQVTEEYTKEVPIYVTENVPGIPGQPVLIENKRVPAKVGDTITLPNGETVTVNEVSGGEQQYLSVKPENRYQMTPPVIVPSDEAMELDAFIEEVNKLLNFSGYAAPVEGAPWKLIRLSGDLVSDSEAITELLADMTAFNAARITEVTEIGGRQYAVLRYDYDQFGKLHDSIYDQQHDRILVKYSMNVSDGSEGFIYIPYERNELTRSEVNEAGFVTSASMPQKTPSVDVITPYEDLSQITFSTVVGDTYWVYADGEFKRESDGSIATRRYISGYDTVTEERVVNKEVTDQIPDADISYNAALGRWEVFILPQAENEEVSYKVQFDPERIVSSAGIEYGSHQYFYDNVKVNATVNTADESSYLKDVLLPYQSDQAIISDAGTRKSPIQVYERPIRQKVKVVKDIHTNPDDQYAHNTYDFDTLKKNVNFRFSAYLKSNLERLYRAEDGTVTWMDRNGNVIPYDKMVAGNGFPAVGEERNDGVFKSNVRKIYTKVQHDTSSNLTSINANNVLSNYKDPEVTDLNVALRVPYSTVIAAGGNAVIANSALYSYRGINDKLWDLDTIRVPQNKGYTRILETIDVEMESGDKLVTVASYNYDKFFDALEVANNDKWDDANPTYTSWKPIGNQANRSDNTIENAKASDKVRQFAIDWYLDDEVIKLKKEVPNNSAEAEDMEGGTQYSDELYDEALRQAIIKAENYLKPFFAYDLDEIYAIPWDSAANGGTDKNLATLSADEDGGDYMYAASSYLPYGTYVLAEKQPKYVGPDEAAFNDFINKHYQTDRPKEVMVPSLYEDGTNNDPIGKLAEHYEFNAAQALTTQAREDNYLIRFGEEWDASANDQRKHVIRAHNNDGDFEVFKYGLEPDKLTGTISYPGGSYGYAGFKITQDNFDPLKDYYNPIHEVEGKAIKTEDGANASSHYLSDDKNKGVRTANGSTYDSDAIEKRYQYGSISEQRGEATSIRFELETDPTEPNMPGAVYKDVTAMQGVQTAYNGLYAPMLVPWAATEPVDEKTYSQDAFNGYADTKFRNRFFTTKLRIEKLDSETHEQILHDGAIFNIYKASRDETTGEVLFYEEDTTIYGTEEFLASMGATDIRPMKRRLSWVDRITGKENAPGTLFTGVVPAGTPVCEESEQIYLGDAKGNRTVAMKSFTTLRDGLMKDEDQNKTLEYQDQTVGYLETPQPLGAGAYVLTEVKPPTGYARTKPIALEVYSDKVTYYKEGNKDKRIVAAIYDDVADDLTQNGNKPQDAINIARIDVENYPIKLENKKLKETGDVTFRVGERIEGTLYEIGGNPDYEYAFMIQHQTSLTCFLIGLRNTL